MYHIYSVNILNAVLIIKLCINRSFVFLYWQQARGGRRKIIASAPVNMKDYASDVPTQHTMTITLKPATKKIVKASIQLTLSCVFLREGKAT